MNRFVGGEALLVRVIVIEVLDIIDGVRIASTIN